MHLRANSGVSSVRSDRGGLGARLDPARPGDPMKLRCRTMADEAVPLSPRASSPAGEVGSFLESLMDTELYSIGAFFCDEHPDLVDEVVTRSEEIEQRGLVAYSKLSGGPIEESFETLLTGLAVRYYKAVAG
jgi:hypothetical protein